MPTNPIPAPLPAHHPRHSHRLPHLLIPLLLGGGLSLLLYLHGTSWWIAPVAVAIAHGVLLAAILLVVSLLTHRRAVPDGAGDAASGGMGSLIHRPRLYDWLVWVVSLGHEGRFRRRTLDLAGLQQEDRVLDVGCGTASLLLTAAQLSDPPRTLVGLEPAPEMAAHARRKARERGVSLEITEGSADRLPYPAASFDVVFCTMVLHHLPEALQEDAMREMRRVLRPGGRIVIVELHRPRSIARGILAMVSLVSFLHRLGSGASHTQVLDIEARLAELGFDGVTCQSFGSGALGAFVGRLSRDQAGGGAALPAGSPADRPAP